MYWTSPDDGQSCSRRITTKRLKPNILLGEQTLVLPQFMRSVGICVLKYLLRILLGRLPSDGALGEGLPVVGFIFALGMFPVQGSPNHKINAKTAKFLLFF